MTKLIPILFLVACGQNNPNGAEFLIQAQAPTAKCESTILKGIDVTVCDVPGKDKVVQFVGAYQKGKLPFQVYPLNDGTEPEKEPPAATPTPPSPGQGSGANVAPSPDADGK